MKMIYHQKHYLLESGPVFEKADAYRKEYIKKHGEILAYVRDIGANAYTLDFNGCLNSVCFVGSAPEGFTKRNGRGFVRPFKKSAWAMAFKSYQMPRVHLWMQEILHCPVCLSYKTHKFHGGSCIGDPFNPIGVYWYRHEGPLLLIIPDVQHYVKEMMKNHPDAEIENEADKWVFPDPNPKEILSEEWDLMAAKYKQGIK